MNYLSAPKSTDKYLDCGISPIFKGVKLDVSATVLVVTTVFTDLMIDYISLLYLTLFCARFYNLMKDN